MRHWRFVVLTALAAALLAAASSPSATIDDSLFVPRTSYLVPPGISLLDRYARGEFDAVLAEVAAADDFDALLAMLQRDAPAWIAAAGPADAPRRRLAAATLAIEAARATDHLDWKWVQQVRLNMGKENPLVAPDLLYWKSPPQLIEWGCTILREAGPPDPAERLWQLGALAVAQRRGDYEFLIGSPWDTRGNPEDEIDHLSHALERFPGEPRLLLAQAIAIEWRTWSPPRRLRFGGPNLPQARRAFEDMLQDPDIGAEAMVRLGSLRLRSRDFNGAADVLARAERATRDPWLLYLARYFAGQAREQQRRPQDAERSYRGALEAIPRATSATMALAALLARGGRHTEAATVVETALSGPAADDPWRAYAAADDRFWPEILGRLRAEIRR